MSVDSPSLPSDLKPELQGIKLFVERIIDAITLIQNAVYQEVTLKEVASLGKGCNVEDMIMDRERGWKMVEKSFIAMDH